MMNSKAEKLLQTNIFLFLRNEFSKGRDDSGFDGFSALPEEFRGRLEIRAKQIAAESKDKRNEWARKWKSLIRDRGRARVLDPDIHPEQIADFLKEETPAVQTIIEKNLPAGLAEKVAIVLRSGTLFSYVKRGNKKADLIEAPEPLVKVIKNKFLSQFVSKEQLFTERRYDRFSMTRLGNLIWRLGLTEIKRSMLDVDTDEQIVRSFDPEIRDDIQSVRLVEAEEKSKRIALAKTFVIRAVNTATSSDDRIRMIGLQVFAIDLRQREAEAARFSIQKLPKVVGDELEGLIKEPFDGADIEMSVFEELERAAVEIEKEVRR